MATTLTSFRRHWSDTDALRWLVAERLEADGKRVASQSRETTTHYKWLLASDRNLRAQIWLHEFKPKRERRPGFASTIHNHRYPFQVVALTGSYLNKRYKVGFDGMSLRIISHELVKCEHFCEGLAYSMEPYEFHCLESIEEGTKTLVMELAPVTLSSFSVDQRGDRMIEHVPLEVRVHRLLQPSAGRMTSSVG